MAESAVDQRAQDVLLWREELAVDRRVEGVEQAHGPVGVSGLVLGPGPLQQHLGAELRLAWDLTQGGVGAGVLLLFEEQPGERVERPAVDLLHSLPTRGDGLDRRAPGLIVDRAPVDRHAADLDVVGDGQPQGLLVRVLGALDQHLGLGGHAGQPEHRQLDLPALGQPRVADVDLVVVVDQRLDRVGQLGVALAPPAHGLQSCSEVEAPEEAREGVERLLFGLVLHAWAQQPDRGDILRLKEVVAPSVDLVEPLGGPGPQPPLEVSHPLPVGDEVGQVVGELPEVGVTDQIADDHPFVKGVGQADRLQGLDRARQQLW